MEVQIHTSDRHSGKNDQNLLSRLAANLFSVLMLCSGCMNDEKLHSFSKSEMQFIDSLKKELNVEFLVNKPLSVIRHNEYHGVYVLLIDCTASPNEEIKEYEKLADDRLRQIAISFLEVMEKKQNYDSLIFEKYSLDKSVKGIEKYKWKKTYVYSISELKKHRL